MNTKRSVSDVISMSEMRSRYIYAMNDAENKTDFARQNAESLFALGLTMYSNVFSFESAAYNGLTKSKLDRSRSLHPEQMEIIYQIENYRGLILSAPTSFGKTFSVFEYIARKQPNTVVLIVPTLALIDEYKRKILNEYRTIFSEYKVHLTINSEKEYDFERKNIFIVTHDRVINEEVHEIIPQIDFLVIDEVYKLQKDENNERVLILNLAYYNMVAISQKYVLLAPFISGVDNLDRLEDKPAFYNTDYSPVVNEVEIVPIIDEKDRIAETDKLLKQVHGKTLVYFPTVRALNEYILSVDSEKKGIDNEILKEFIKWARNEIHEEWTTVKALEQGMLVHHGQLPMGIRMLELDLFDKESGYDVMLCASTLLEGVNTTAENIIITKPARNDCQFDAFDFYNLVGRTGRLFKHCLGKAFYIKMPDDREYTKGEALKSIEFELTSDSIDIDINKGTYSERNEFIAFLELLGTDYESYKQEVSAKVRFKTAQEIFDRYRQNKSSLLTEIDNLMANPEKGKIELIRELYSIAEGTGYRFKLNTFVINKLTYKRRQSVKQVVDETAKYYTHEDIQTIIRTVLDKKNSYIEYNFYKRLQIIVYFMRCQNVDEKYIRTIDSYLLTTIEKLYYINMPAHRMLKEMGVYENDIQTIINAIGDDFQTVDELQGKLRQKDVTRQISIVSRYVINRLILS